MRQVDAAIAKLIYFMMHDAEVQKNKINFNHINAVIYKPVVGSTEFKIMRPLMLDITMCIKKCSSKASRGRHLWS